MNHCRRLILSSGCAFTNKEELFKMKQLTGAQIRQMYLDFFKEKGLIFEINTQDVKSTEASAQIEEIFMLITKELDAIK